MNESGTADILLPVDWIVMGIYLLFLIGLGIYYRRFAEASMDNFFLGGRKLKGWLAGTSFAATFYNAEVGSVYVGLTVSTGMFICWWFFSRFGLALLVAAVLFAVFWRRLHIFTSPEFYELRFPGKAGTTIRSWVTIRSACIAVVAWTGAGLLGLSFVSQELLGWSKIETLVVVVPIILVYVYLSGYMGVVVSDVLQGTILIGTTLLLAILVLIDFGGDAGFLAGPKALHDALLTALPNNPEVVSWLPPIDHEFLGLLGVFCWVLGKSVGYGGDTAPVGAAMEGQRLLSTANPREASKMYLWTVGLLFLMLTVLTLPGLGALALRPELYTAPAAEREAAFGWLLGQYMPPGLLGLASSGAICCDYVDRRFQHEPGRPGTAQRCVQTISEAACRVERVYDGWANRDDCYSLCRCCYCGTGRLSDRVRRPDVAIFIGRAAGQLGPVVVVAIQRAGANSGLVRRRSLFLDQSVFDLRPDGRGRNDNGLNIGLSCGSFFDGSDYPPLGDCCPADKARRGRKIDCFLRGSQTPGLLEADSAEGKHRTKPTYWKHIARPRHCVSWSDSTLFGHNRILCSVPGSEWFSFPRISGCRNCRNRIFLDLYPIYSDTRKRNFMTQPIDSTDFAAVRDLLRGPAALQMPTFNDDLSLNTKFLKENIRFAYEGGLRRGRGFLICPSGTGEFQSLTYDEHVAMVEAAVQATDGELPVMAGMATPSFGYCHRTGRPLAGCRCIGHHGASPLLLQTR